MDCQDTGAVRALIRLLAGVGDFARYNKHFPRQKQLKLFALSPFRCLCLACFMNGGKRVLDSEWHAFLDCPLHNTARGRFVEASGCCIPATLPSTPDDFAVLFTSVRKDARLVGSLAHFAHNIQTTRRHNFRHLSSDGPHGRRKVVQRVIWERWRAGMRNPARYVSVSFLGRDSSP